MVQVIDSEHVTFLHATKDPAGPVVMEGKEKIKINRWMIQFVEILDDVQIDDQLQLKLMILANCRKCCPRLAEPMTAVFMDAKHRQPLLIEMKGGARIW